MEPLRIYDYLADSRSRVLAAVRGVGPGPYEREFPVGLGTLGRILTHIMTSEWYYVERLAGREVPPYSTWPMRQDEPPPLDVIERAWSEQAVRTRGVLEAMDWTLTIEYIFDRDDGKRDLVTARATDVVTQLILHEMHHRSQVLNILRQLDVTVADLDFNLATYQRRELA